MDNIKKADEAIEQAEAFAKQRLYASAEVWAEIASAHTRIAQVKLDKEVWEEDQE